MAEGARKGWRRVKFGEMAENINERVDDPKKAGATVYVGLEHLDSDSLKIRRWGSPDDVEATKLRFYKGDIIFGRRRAYQRKLGVAEFDGICSAHAMVLRAKPDVVVPGFLPFFMQSDAFMERAQEISVGSLSPTINWTTLRDEEFDLPPREEQWRRAEALAATDNLLVALTAAEDDAVRLRRATLASAKNCESWRSTDLGSIARIVTGATPKRARPDFWGGDVPWLPTGKVNDRRIKYADEFVTQAGRADAGLETIPKGSTLIAMIGEGRTRGTCALLEIDATINQNFGAVLPRLGVDPWFLFCLLEGKYDELRAWSQGTNQHALSRGLLMTFPVALPALDDQLEIGGQFREVDRAVDALRQRRKTLASIRQQLITGQYLSGEREREPCSTRRTPSSL